MDIEELLAAAKLPEKELRICLRGDLYAELAAAEAALGEAERQAKADGSLAAGTGRREAAERVARVRERMLAASAVFRLRAVSRRLYTELLGKHPPRDGDARDAATGFNRDEFFDALTFESIAEPAMNAEQWQRLADRLSDPQFEALTEAAWEINRQGVDVPFSSAASLALLSTGAGSGRPEDSASASSGSTAGSPSPSTSTTAGGSSRPARKRSGTKSSKS
jgi:hypothetical protein